MGDPSAGLLRIEEDPEQIVAYLGEQHRIAIRSIPDNGSLRVSTGFYNTEAEIDTLVRALTAYQHSH